MTSFPSLHLFSLHCPIRVLQTRFPSLSATLLYHLPLLVPGTLFLFCSKRADKIKGLLWEGDGFLLLTEQIALMNQRSFGRKTEQADQMHRLSLFEVFNEAEFFSDDPEDPVLSEIVVPSYTRKPKTLSEENSCPSSMEKTTIILLWNGSLAVIRTVG